MSKVTDQYSKAEAEWIIRNYRRGIFDMLASGGILANVGIKNLEEDYHRYIKINPGKSRKDFEFDFLSDVISGAEAEQILSSNDNKIRELQDLLIFNMDKINER